MMMIVGTHLMWPWLQMMRTMMIIQMMMKTLLHQTWKTVIQVVPPKKLAKMISQLHSNLLKSIHSIKLITYDCCLRPKKGYPTLWVALYPGVTKVIMKSTAEQCWHCSNHGQVLYHSSLLIRPGKMPLHVTSLLRSRNRLWASSMSGMNVMMLETISVHSV